MAELHGNTLLLKYDNDSSINLVAGIIVYFITVLDMLAYLLHGAESFLRI